MLVNQNLAQQNRSIALVRKKYKENSKENNHKRYVMCFIQQRDIELNLVLRKTRKSERIISNFTLPNSIHILQCPLI